MNNYLWIVEGKTITLIKIKIPSALSAQWALVSLLVL